MPPDEVEGRPLHRGRPANVDLLQVNLYLLLSSLSLSLHPSCVRIFRQIIFLSMILYAWGGKEEAKFPALRSECQLLA